MHGGGYVVGGGDLAVKAVQAFAARIQTRIYTVDYRMPPDWPYPAAVDDVVMTYKDVLLRHGARDPKLPLPGAAVLLTPEVDLSESDDTFETNQDIDTVLVKRLSETIQLYADGHDLRDPT